MCVSMKVCECFVLVLEHFLAAEKDVITVVGTSDCSTDRNSLLDPVICSYMICQEQTVV